MKFMKQAFWLVSWISYELIPHVKISSFLQQPYIADNDEDDAGDSDDAVLALTTAINITERKVSIYMTD